MSVPTNQFQFGNQTITTQVFVMTPKRLMGIAPFVDVTSAMDERPANRGLSLKVVSAAASVDAGAAADPFAGIEV